MPLVLSSILLIGIVVLALKRYMHGLSVWAGYPVDVDLVFVGLYVLWMLREIPIATSDMRQEGTRSSDYGTCQLYGFGQAATILTALWLPSVWSMPGIAHLAGIVLFVCGVSYRLWAIRSLGRFYSHRVREVVEHRIVTSGPYRFTRHPAYTGMIVANTGVCVYFLNWVTLCVFIFILLPAIVLRILIYLRAAPIRFEQHLNRSNKYSFWSHL